MSVDLRDIPNPGGLAGAIMDGSYDGDFCGAPPFDGRAMEYATQQRELDEAKTGRGRCIGCGKFLKNDARWNQCSDCDTRDPEDY